MSDKIVKTEFEIISEVAQTIDDKICYWCEHTLAWHLPEPHTCSFDGCKCPIFVDIAPAPSSDDKAPKKDYLTWEEIASLASKR